MNVVELETKQVNNLDVHFIQTEKFKTIYLVIKMKSLLSKDTITQRALLPYLLRQGTKNYPSEIELQNKLDDLYGASLSLDGAKKGDYHIISVRLEVANDKYIPGEKNLIEDSLKLLREIIYETNRVEDGFDPRVFKREQKTLRNSIESLIDDKMRYANMRLIDEMCEGERYSTRVHGYIDQLEKLDEKVMFSFYESLLEEDEMDLYVLGDFNRKSMEDMIKRHFSQPRRNKLISPEERVAKDRGESKEIIEKQDIQQAKLHLGFRTNCTIDDQSYFALQVFNGLFGGFPSSKLFLNVREKHSLAYYAASRLESLKGLLLVFSGIDSINYDKAKTIIIDQLMAIQKGDFTEENIAETKEQLINNILETMDHSDGIVEMFYQQQFTSINRTLADIVRGIEQVNKEDILRVSKKIEQDTIYFLTAEEGGAND